MNMEERGLYHSCLNFSWVNGGLPADSGELARAMNLSRAKLGKLWQRVGRCFQTGPSGYLINPRQEEERQQAVELSEQKSEAGKRGNAKRWGDRKGIAERSLSDSNGITRAYDYVSVSESVVTTDSKQTAEERPDFDVWAEGIYGQWKKYRDKTLAMHSLCELTGESTRRFVSNYPKWLEYHERAGWQYAPTLASFLHDRTYEHEPPAIGEPQRRKSAADEAQDRAIEQMKKQEGWE